MGVTRNKTWRASVHTYPVEIPLPTVLWLNPPGRLQFGLYLWPWVEGEDGERGWRSWRPRRGSWPPGWRDQRLSDGSPVYRWPIFWWVQIGPLHVRYFRQLPPA